MEVVGPKNSVISEASPGYTGKRILVASFQPAVKCLKEGLKQVTGKGIFQGKPDLVMRPMEMSEGGLSEVEERVLLEVGHAAGAKRVSVA